MCERERFLRARGFGVVAALVAVDLKLHWPVVQTRVAQTRQGDAGQWQSTAGCAVARQRREKRMAWCDLLGGALLRDLGFLVCRPALH